VAGEPPRDRETVDVERFTGPNAGPEDRVFIVQIHAGTKRTAHAAGDQFPCAGNARQFLARGFGFSPQRLALCNQPLRRFKDKRVDFGNSFYAGPGDLQVLQGLSQAI